ncbi:MAG TPA: hypothetical protein VH592_06505 [Gemmataceae bacterium]|jgi:hypothetical protein
MSEAPIYTSKCTAKNLWQEYRIYEDRVELHTWFGPWAIPFDQIESVEISEPLLKAALHGRFDATHWPRQLKIDMADKNEHVVLDKSTGIFKTIYFTPDQPSAFRDALEEAIKHFRVKQTAERE